MKIENSNFLITGSNRGIGQAVAFEAAKRGAILHLVNRTLSPEVKSKCLELGAKGVTEYQLDLSDRQNLERFLSEQAELPVDILFNNSGQLTGGLLENQALDDIYNLIQVNVAALIHMTRGFLPGMVKRKKGLIVNHSSVAAFLPIPCSTTYSASKAAVYAFSECLKGELTGTGVEVLVLITPGIETRMYNEIFDKYGSHMDTSALSSISADQYAVRICDAIVSGKDTLSPTGFTGWGVVLARRWPAAFRKLAVRRFNREAQK